MSNNCRKCLNDHQPLFRKHVHKLFVGALLPLLWHALMKLNFRNCLIDHQLQDVRGQPEFPAPVNRKQPKQKVPGLLEFPEGSLGGKSNPHPQSSAAADHQEPRHEAAAAVPPTQARLEVHGACRRRNRLSWVLRLVAPPSDAARCLDSARTIATVIRSWRSHRRSGRSRRLLAAPAACSTAVDLLKPISRKGHTGQSNPCGK